MKFPYIPISFAIADVRSEMKRMNQAGDIIEEDCINWTVETLREIGGGNYVTDAAIVNIRNNTGTLPPNFYLIDEMWLCDADPVTSQTDNTIWFTKEHRGFNKRSIIFPGDAFSTKYCKDGNTPNQSPNTPTYIIRHPNQIRLSLPTATVGLIFTALPTASDSGEILMQDEIYTLKAVKAYMKKMLLAEKYYMGQVTENIWQNICRDYDQNLDQAQAIFKFPDPADDQARGYMQDHRYDQFKLR